MRERRYKKNGQDLIELTIHDLMHPSGLRSYSLMRANKDEIKNQQHPGTRAFVYLHCGFYQEALEEIHLYLQCQPNSYDAFLKKSACFFAFAEDKAYNLHQKEVLYSADDKTLQNEFEKFEQLKISPLNPNILFEILYGDNLELDKDLVSFVQSQHHQFYSIAREEPQRITSPYSNDDYLYWQGNGKSEGWMPVFRIFRFLFRRRTWIELDPVSGQETPIDREDILDDLDIPADDEEENGHSQS